MNDNAAMMMQGIVARAGDGLNASTTTNANTPEVSQKIVGASSEA
ncbi:MAG: hypothetical protein QOH67_3573 [Hyphomicrobiales bacterium]|nr:hypothetical protein [Hyphomicrobiales bacterium]